MVFYFHMIFVQYMRFTEALFFDNWFFKLELAKIKIKYFPEINKKNVNNLIYVDADVLFTSKLEEI